MASQQLGMFDIDGDDKLSTESVEQREAIIQHYAQMPQSLFFLSSSGGKDSDIMAITVQRIVPASKIVYVHATLGDSIEHTGIVDHIKRYKPNTIPLHVVKNERKDFVDMVLLRGMFPSPQYRQCTSDLKTQVIDKFIRHEMKRRGATVGFNCIGLRSKESVPRSKRSPLFINKRLTLKSGQRTVFDWLPVFHLTEKDVFQGIIDADQLPFHIYNVQNVNGTATKSAKGNDRTSCRFCIMGSQNDLTNGAKNYPDSYAMMIALERVVGHTMFSKKVKDSTIPVSLADKAGVRVDEVAIRRWMLVLNARRDSLKEQRDAQLKAKMKSKCGPIIATRQIDTFTLTMNF